MNALEALLASEEYILLDGAMGTVLMELGLTQGAPPEAWNVEHPERIQQVHRLYIDAGSRLVLTNSFGGTRNRLKLHNLQDRATELNEAAAANARAAADEVAQTVVVAGSMGPTGELLEPMGTMTFAEAKTSFAEQATGLAAGGADVLWIETMSDLNEVRAAYEGARSVSELPIAATLSFDTNGRTMMGITPGRAAEALRELDLIAIGANCGNNLPDTEAAVAAMHEAAPDIPIISKANAGIPRWEGSDLVYDGTTDVMAAYAVRVRDLGARLIGACCGSSPAHIRAMAAALSGGMTLAEAEAEADATVSGYDDEATAEQEERRKRRSRRRRRRRERK